MSALTATARTILETAVDAQSACANPSDWTVFFGPGGGLELLAGCETPLDALFWSRGASMAWQVKHADGGVCVEGRSSRENCRLAAQGPRPGGLQSAARAVLAPTRLYQVALAA